MTLIKTLDNFSTPWYLYFFTDLVILMNMYCNSLKHASEYFRKGNIKSSLVNIIELFRYSSFLSGAQTDGKDSKWKMNETLQHYISFIFKQIYQVNKEISCKKKYINLFIYLLITGSKCS